MLSHQLMIVDLVSRYLANYLIIRTPINKRRSYNCNVMPHRNVTGY
jgi:hypothetical protein